ncbi:MAG: hypothetical protein RQ885_04380 [Desulfurococcales archaeon]|jgi:hypothetical protein|nr:hypothetical protein [Desulfurococcales archaeon]
MNKALHTAQVSLEIMSVDRSPVPLGLDAHLETLEDMDPYPFG